MRMTTMGLLVFLLLAVAAGAAGAASAYEGELKRGRLYFRQICTACHQEMAGKVIAPNERLKADWAAYIKADKHDKTGKSNPSVKYFTSKAYRETIKGKNKAAEKLLNANDAELHTDVEAWLEHSAKDSDNPAGCS